MFKLFKKHIDNCLYAPVSGKCIDIVDVNDIGFSSKAMGDGIAIIPNDNVLRSPCDGVIKMLFRTCHAIGIEASNGAEILIHIGIDTVNLNGEGFKAMTKVNAKVRKGDPLIEIDLDKLKADYDMTTMVIITNGKSFSKVRLNENIESGMCILEG